VKFRFKISSYLVKTNRGYSTLSPSLDPHWFTGFADAEGCFKVTVRRQKGFTGWGVSADFSLNLHAKDLPLLYKIQSFLGGVGRIHVSSGGKTVSFTVSKIDDLIYVIIPHFKKYPLQSGKSIDFQLWNQCVEMLVNKQHLNLLGLNKIIGLKSALNVGLSEDLKLEFNNVIPMERPAYVADSISLNPNWVSGFTEGDGSFHVSISPKTDYVRRMYSICLNKRDLPLIIKIQEYFGGIGNISHYAKNNAVQFTVADLKSINERIIPQFDTYVFCGNKLTNYLIWREILMLVNSKAHLTTEGLKTIEGLKSNLNQW